MGTDSEQRPLWQVKDLVCQDEQGKQPSKNTLSPKRDLLPLHSVNHVRLLEGISAYLPMSIASPIVLYLLQPYYLATWHRLVIELNLQCKI